TAYDAPTARLADAAEIDTVLVGDSVANVVLGYKDTLPVTMEQMLHHTAAVRRGLERAMLIADLPFLSYQANRAEAIRNAGRFLKEAGAEAVKLEGGGPMVGTVRALTEAGIPVVGHLGLTPQSATMLGGYRVQGTTAESAGRILEDALALQEAGAFLLVLECVPARLGRLISEKLTIPVIGIGAGPHTDGQVLVFHDLVGIDAGFKPKFVKRFAEAGKVMRQALEKYAEEVRARAFPGPEHQFSMSDEEYEKLLGKL
ncbi:MAG: 3-methyl-2-oxobutanoate hydroxymethyltransferase, partial [Deltaproteobacteria bacterium]